MLKFNILQDESYNDKHEEYWQEDSQRPDERDDWKTRPAASVDDAAYYQGKPHMKGKRIVASEASQHVIFLGLDTDFVESDVGTILLFQTHDANFF